MLIVGKGKNAIKVLQHWQYESSYFDCWDYSSWEVEFI